LNDVPQRQLELVFAVYFILLAHFHVPAELDLQLDIRPTDRRHQTMLAALL
jgi:hypothetical protein